MAVTVWWNHIAYILIRLPLYLIRTVEMQCMQFWLELCLFWTSHLGEAWVCRPFFGGIENVDDTGAFATASWTCYKKS